MSLTGMLKNLIALIMVRRMISITTLSCALATFARHVRGAG
jgi:hypothetical protein